MHCTIIVHFCINPLCILYILAYMHDCRAEIEEREKDREEQIAKKFQEKEDTLSLVLTSLNNKLILQNSLWVKLKKQ